MNIDAQVSCGRTRDWRVELTVTMRALSDIEISPTEGAYLYVTVKDESGNKVSKRYLPKNASKTRLKKGDGRSYSYSLDRLVSDTTYTVQVYVVGFVLPLEADHQQVTEAKINPA